MKEADYVKLLDYVGNTLRIRHYAMKTERSSAEGIKGFVRVLKKGILWIGVKRQSTLTNKAEHICSFRRCTWPGEEVYDH